MHYCSFMVGNTIAIYYFLALVRIQLKIVFKEKQQRAGVRRLVAAPVPPFFCAPARSYRRSNNSK